MTTASQEFRGHFSQLFTQNAGTASSDATNIVDALETIAGWIDTMKAAAADERARRKTAREWQEREDGRNGFQDFLNDTVHYDPMPTVENEPAPKFDPPAVTTKPRDTPNPGAGGGGGGGTSSARPADLRSFATGSSALNRALDGKPGALRGKLADFAAKCSWAHIDAGSVVTAFEQWIAANDQDVTWANTVADAFAAAGGEGEVSTVADSGRSRARRGRRLADPHRSAVRAADGLRCPADDRLLDGPGEHHDGQLPRAGSTWRSPVHLRRCR